MRNSRILSTWVIAMAAVLAAGGAIFQGLKAPLSSGQETIVSSSTQVVVVLIPGFPVESIILGTFLGLAALIIIRRRRNGSNGKRRGLAAG